MSAQFTQQDPIGIAGGLNLYGYANGDPINFSDPFGLGPCDHLWTEPPGEGADTRATAKWLDNEFRSWNICMLRHYAAEDARAGWEASVTYNFSLAECSVAAGSLAIAFMSDVGLAAGVTGLSRVALGTVGAGVGSITGGVLGASRALLERSGKAFVDGLTGLGTGSASLARQYVTTAPAVVAADALAGNSISLAPFGGWEGRIGAVATDCAR